MLQVTLESMLSVNSGIYVLHTVVILLENYLFKQNLHVVTCLRYFVTKSLVILSNMYLNPIKYFKLKLALWYLSFI